MYDLLGGGFHRYSVDEHWLVPHFEKMLYDNALLAPVYLHAWVVTGDERYREVAERDARVRAPRARAAGGRLRLGAGRRHRRRRGTDVHLDAGGARGGASRARRSAAAVRARTLVLRGELTDAERRAAVRGARAAAEAGARRQGDRLLERARARRARRSRPAARADDCLDAAGGLAEFLLGPLSAPDERLHRTFRAGRAKGTGYLEDYANVANGLYELHVATGELRWLEEANRLARLAVDLFADDERGGFFLTPADGEALVARKKELDDHPTPSGNSMLAYVLLRLARIYGDDELERRAVGVFRLVHGVFPRAPSAFGRRCARSTCTSRRRGRSRSSATPTTRSPAPRSRPFEPNAVVAFGPAEDVPLLEGKGSGRPPAVYVCERFACRAPVTDGAALSP